jgi:nucleotide-binding universal stress UspA family protein
MTAQQSCLATSPICPSFPFDYSRIGLAPAGLRVGFFQRWERTLPGFLNAAKNSQFDYSFVIGKSRIRLAQLLPVILRMIDEVVACLDGSPFAEQILPLAHCVAAGKSVPLTIVRVVADREEFSAEEAYLKEWAHAYGARLKVLVSEDTSAAIIAELEKSPGAIPAMTTHGRTAWGEAILGSVAFEVLRSAKRPALLYRPQPVSLNPPRKITTVVAALDGGKFAEAILPAAAEIALVLKSNLLLLQVLAPERFTPGNLAAGDVLESSYLRNTAIAVQQRHGILPNWDVLHGEPGDALCRYLCDMPDTLLALTTHARTGLRRALFGSIAAHCVRNAGLPMLLYWPPEPSAQPRVASQSDSSASVFDQLFTDK